jgi:hypothetical protein
MDDDDTSDSGLGGLAMYQLGRMAAETDHAQSQAVAAMFARRQPQIDVNGLINQNRALAAENARLRHSLTEYKLNYEELLRWSDGAEKTIKELRKKTG